jgi:hypothetical protein
MHEFLPYFENIKSFPRMTVLENRVQSIIHGSGGGASAEAEQICLPRSYMICTLQ